MTNLCEATHCCVIAALENWARWCNRGTRLNDFCDCPTNWQMIEQVEYKNTYLTAQERLDDALAQDEPNERWALAVERAVQGLDRSMRAAIRVRWVMLPDSDKPSILTAEQWDERRARFAGKLRGWYLSLNVYREVLYDAERAIEGAL